MQTSQDEELRSHSLLELHRLWRELQTLKQGLTVPVMEAPPPITDATSQAADQPPSLPVATSGCSSNISTRSVQSAPTPHGSTIHSSSPTVRSRLPTVLGLRSSSTGIPAVQPPSTQPKPSAQLKHQPILDNVSSCPASPESGVRSRSSSSNSSRLLNSPNVLGVPGYRFTTTTAPSSPSRPATSSNSLRSSSNSLSTRASQPKSSKTSAQSISASCTSLPCSPRQTVQANAPSRHTAVQAPHSARLHASSGQPISASNRPSTTIPRQPSFNNHDIKAKSNASSSPTKVIVTATTPDRLSSSRTLSAHLLDIDHNSEQLLLGDEDVSADLDHLVEQDPSLGVFLAAANHADAEFLLSPRPVSARQPAITTPVPCSQAHRRSNSGEGIGLHATTPFPLSPTCTVWQLNCPPTDTTTAACDLDSEGLTPPHALRRSSFDILSAFNTAASVLHRRESQLIDGASPSSRSDHFNLDEDDDDLLSTVLFSRPIPPTQHTPHLQQLLSLPTPLSLPTSPAKETSCAETTETAIVTDSTTACEILSASLSAPAGGVSTLPTQPETISAAFAAGFAAGIALAAADPGMNVTSARHTSDTVHDSPFLQSSRKRDSSSSGQAMPSIFNKRNSSSSGQMSLGLTPSKGDHAASWLGFDNETGLYASGRDPQRPALAELGSNPSGPERQKSSEKGGSRSSSLHSLLNDLVCGVPYLPDHLSAFANASMKVCTVTTQGTATASSSPAPPALTSSASSTELGPVTPLAAESHTAAGLAGISLASASGSSSTVLAQHEEPQAINLCTSPSAEAAAISDAETLASASEVATASSPPLTETAAGARAFVKSGSVPSVRSPSSMHAEMEAAQVSSGLRQMSRSSSRLSRSSSTKEGSDGSLPSMSVSAMADVDSTQRSAPFVLSMAITPEHSSVDGPLLESHSLGSCSESSGSAGGSPEKQRVVKDLGIRAISVGRGTNEGVSALHETGSPVLGCPVQHTPTSDPPTPSPLVRTISAPAQPPSSPASRPGSSTTIGPIRPTSLRRQISEGAPRMSITSLPDQSRRQIAAAACTEEEDEESAPLRVAGAGTADVANETTALRRSTFTQSLSRLSRSKRDLAVATDKGDGMGPVASDGLDHGGDAWGTEGGAQLQGPTQPPSAAVPAPSAAADEAAPLPAAYIGEAAAALVARRGLIRTTSRLSRGSSGSTGSGSSDIAAALALLCANAESVSSSQIDELPVSGLNHQHQGAPVGVDMSRPAHLHMAAAMAALCDGGILRASQSSLRFSNPTGDREVAHMLAQVRENEVEGPSQAIIAASQSTPTSRFQPSPPHRHPGLPPSGPSAPARRAISQDGRCTGSHLQPAFLKAAAAVDAMRATSLHRPPSRLCQSFSGNESPHQTVPLTSSSARLLAIHDSPFTFLDATSAHGRAPQICAPATGEQFPAYNAAPTFTHMAAAIANERRISRSMSRLRHSNPSGERDMFAALVQIHGSDPPQSPPQTLDGQSHALNQTSHGRTGAAPYADIEIDITPFHSNSGGDATVPDRGSGSVPVYVEIAEVVASMRRGKLTRTQSRLRSSNTSDDLRSFSNERSSDGTIAAQLLQQHTSGHSSEAPVVWDTCIISPTQAALDATSGGHSRSGFPPTMPQGSSGGGADANPHSPMLRTSSGGGMYQVLPAYLEAGASLALRRAHISRSSSRLSRTASSHEDEDAQNGVSGSSTDMASALHGARSGFASFIASNRDNAIATNHSGGGSSTSPQRPSSLGGYHPSPGSPPRAHPFDGGNDVREVRGAGEATSTKPWRSSDGSYDLSVPLPPQRSIDAPQGPAFLEAMTSVTSKRMITRSASRLRPASMCGEDSLAGSETSSGPLYDPHLVSMFGITAGKAALMHAGAQVLAGMTPWTSNSSGSSILALSAHSSYGVPGSSGGSGSAALPMSPAERGGSAAQQAAQGSYAASHLRPRMSAPQQQQQPLQAFELAAGTLYRPHALLATATTGSSGDGTNYIIGADRSSAGSSVDANMMNSGMMDPERISPPSPHSPHPLDSASGGLPSALNTPRRSSCSRGASRLRLSTRALVVGSGIEQPDGIDVDLTVATASVPEGHEDISARAGGALAYTTAQPLTTIASQQQLQEEQQQPRIVSDASPRGGNSGGVSGVPAMVTVQSRSRIVLGAAPVLSPRLSPDNTSGVLPPQSQAERGSSSTGEVTEVRAEEGVSDTSATARSVHTTQQLAKGTQVASLQSTNNAAVQSSSAAAAAVLEQAPKRSFWAILCGCGSPPQVEHD